MYCTNCGRYVPDHASRCPHCGELQNDGIRKKSFIDFDVPKMDIAGLRKRAAGLVNAVQGKEDPENASVALRMRRMTGSFQKIKSMAGYYCTGCGEYIDRNKAYLNNAVTCSYCGGRIIAPDRINQTIRAFNQSGISGIFTSGAEDTSHQQIADYYASSYYKNTQKDMEDVVSDRQLTGEYIVSARIDEALRSFRNLHYHIYYDLVLPEPDGRFTKIDVLIVSGTTVIVLSTGGHNEGFLVNRLDDEYWIRQFAGKAEPVQNPLLKNANSIALLKYCTATLPVSYEHMYSIVVVKELTERSKRPEDILELKLGAYGICKTKALASRITEILQQELRAKTDDTFFTEKYMTPLLHELDVRSKLTEAQKARRDIQANAPRRMSVYNYFYTQNSLDAQTAKPYLVRTNGTYIESYQQSGGWMNANDLFQIVENEIRWKAWELPFMVLENDTDRLAAALCIMNESLFANYETLFREKEETGEPKDASFEQDFDGNAEQSSASTEGTTEGKTQIPADFQAVYFKGCHNEKELTLRYKALAKIYHPDSEGGDMESFKLLQMEFEKLKGYLAEE